MNLRIKQMCIVLTLVSTSLSMFATHYINNTGKVIKITNVSAKKRTKKSYFSFFMTKKDAQQDDQTKIIYFIDLQDDQEGDLDNKQDDEITITSQGISDKRKLFPTNNSFNYVITMNKYKSVFEKFDINHAGEEDKVEKVKKTKKMHVRRSSKSEVGKHKTKKMKQDNQ